MKLDQFIAHVRKSANLNSKEEAEKAIEATFKTLANRIYGDEAKDLASQLPEGIGQYLHGHEGENGTYMSLEEFYQSVAEREGVDFDAAEAHVKIVFSVLQEAVTPGQFSDLRSNLPENYRPLFEGTGYEQVPHKA